MASTLPTTTDIRCRDGRRSRLGRAAPMPRCPDDGILMRDIPGGWVCPHCGHVQQAQDVEMPPEFDGPDLDQRR